jgi:integrase
MKTSIFASVLADRFTEFVALRRAGGADYRGRAQVLSYFDRFLCQEHFQGCYPNRAILDRYVRSLNRLHPNTRINRLSVVRQFCAHLRQYQPHCHVPEPGLGTRRTPSQTPHLFSEGEIQRLLAAARQLSPSGSLRPQTSYTLFGLLYTTGLRVGEALALNLADIDLAQQRLYVHRGKFGKSRWVPLSGSTCRALERYLHERIGLLPATSADPFFVNLNGRRLCHQTVYSAFRQALRRCGLRGGKGDPGPHPHHLRHSYACQRLLIWYGQGKNVNALLPALATYLGHVCVTSTQVYLRATTPLLEKAQQRFHQHFLHHVLNPGQPPCQKAKPHER